MDIGKLKKEKLIMEREILRAINKATISFRERTGFMPNSIDVNILEVNRFGGVSDPEYVLGSVVCNIKVI